MGNESLLEPAPLVLEVLDIEMIYLVPKKQ